MKKFMVTGTPRSGTTFLCSRLASLDNVHMDKHNGYEPFGFNCSVVDEEEYLKQLSSDHPDKIVGFKTWWDVSFMMTDHLRDYDPIILIRKDIKKVFLSYIILLKLGSDNNNSSRKINGSESIVYNTMGMGLSYTAHQLLRSYYYSEKIATIHKMYFEDLVNNSSDNSKLENYFDRKIDLNPKYNESDLTDYFKDPEPFLKVLRETALMMDHKKFPDYVRENLHI